MQLRTMRAAWRRRARRWEGLRCGAASLVGAVCAALPSAAPEGEAQTGRLVAEGPGHVWMGDFPASQSQTVRFRLRNPGPGPVGIRAVSKSCGCADAEMTTNWVTAGAEVGITLRTQPDKLVGSFSKSVYVITTAADPQFRATQLTLAER